MNIEVKRFDGCSEELIETMCSFENSIFSNAPYSEEKIRRECSAKYQLLGLVAYSNGIPVGYKVGYEITSRLFLSWMGGVLHEYRHKGIARSLMEQQHKMMKDLGYKVVRTYTENQYRDMLILNIRSGFDIVGVMNDLSKPKVAIILDKQL